MRKAPGQALHTIKLPDQFTQALLIQTFFTGIGLVALEIPCFLYAVLLPQRS
jgi:hypothetical protein